MTNLVPDFAKIACIVDTCSIINLDKIELAGQAVLYYMRRSFDIHVCDASVTLTRRSSGGWAWASRKKGGLEEERGQEHILGNPGRGGKKVCRARPDQCDACGAVVTFSPVVESTAPPACCVIGNVMIQLRWPRRTGAFVRGVSGHSGGPRRQVRSQSQVNRRWRPEPEGFLAGAHPG